MNCSGRGGNNVRPCRYARGRFAKNAVVTPGVGNPEPVYPEFFYPPVCCNPSLTGARGLSGVWDQLPFYCDVAESYACPCS